jgi:hypothetical protein
MTQPEPQGPQFEGYPRDYVLAAFADRARAGAVLIDLHEAGLARDVMVVRAPGDIREATPAEAHPDARAFLLRLAERLVANRNGLDEYERAVVGGGVVIGVPAAHPEVRERIVEIMRRHDGESLRFLGLAVEDLSRGGTTPPSTGT